MGKAAVERTEGRLNDLVAALEPVNARISVLDASVDHLAAALEPVPAQLAVLAATVERLADENRTLRTDLAATQRQLLQISWSLVAALLAGAGALIAALI